MTHVIANIDQNGRARDMVQWSFELFEDVTSAQPVVELVNWKNGGTQIEI